MSSDQAPQNPHDEAPTTTFEAVRRALNLVYDRPEVREARERLRTVRIRGARPAARSDLQLQAVLDILPVGVFIADARGRLLHVNRAARAIWADVTPLSPGPETYDSDYPAWWPDGTPVQSREWGMARALSTGEVVAAEEMRIEGPGEEPRWILNYALPIRDEAGRVVGGVALNVDITERRRAQETLTERETQFRTLANSIPQLAWMADPEGWIFWYNERWYEYTGTTLEAVEGWGWKAVHHPDHVDRVVRRLAESWETGEPWEDTFPLRGADGEYRWFLSRALPIRDASGEVVRWFGTNTDVTEQRELEAELRRLNEEARKAVRARDEMIGILSHDLRDPLGTVQMAAGLIQDPTVPEALRRRQAAIIDRATTHMTGLVDDLLDVTRLDAGRLRLELEPTDACALAREAAELVRSRAEAAGVAISVDAPEPGPALSVDRTRVVQVLTNLLGNAVDHAGGGSVSVAVRIEPDEVVFTVSDTGTGIAPENLERVFDRFWQADGPSVGGAGLGLAIARGIVAAHGGTIRAESRVGEGSDFSFRLPRG